MGLEQTKHEYIDRDIFPELLTLIRFAEAVSPQVVGVPIVVGTINLSRYILGLGCCLRALVSTLTRGRSHAPMVTWSLLHAMHRRRTSDPGPDTFPRGAGAATKGGGCNALLAGLA